MATSYLLTLYVTLEQELCIRDLFGQHGWRFIKKEEIFPETLKHICENEPDRQEFTTMGNEEEDGDDKMNDDEMEMIDGDHDDVDNHDGMNDDHDDINGDQDTDDSDVKDQDAVEVIDDYCDNGGGDDDHHHHQNINDSNVKEADPISNDSSSENTQSYQCIMYSVNRDSSPDKEKEEGHDVISSEEYQKDGSDDNFRVKDEFDSHENVTVESVGNLTDCSLGRTEKGNTDGDCTDIDVSIALLPRDVQEVILGEEYSKHSKRLTRRAQEKRVKARDEDKVLPVHVRRNPKIPSRISSKSDKISEKSVTQRISVQKLKQTKRKYLRTASKKEEIDGKTESKINKTKEMTLKLIKRPVPSRRRWRRRKGEVINPNDLLCKECGMECRNPKSFANHQRSHNTKPRKRPELPSDNVCPICNKTFRKAGYVTLHMRVHSGEKPYVCQICGKSFTFCQNLSLHKQVHSTEKEKKFKCHFCDASFHRKRSLDIHVRRHTLERPYVCEFCGMAFRDPVNVKRHRRAVHEKLKPHKCTICDAAFAQSNSLKVHMFVHTRENKYECDVCSKAFPVKKRLMRHSLVHTGVRNHPCPHCHKRFARLDSMKYHVKTQHKTINYHCRICNKTFTTQNGLHLHEMSHENLEENFECPQCKESFPNYDNLLIHKLSHHSFQTSLLPL